MLLAKLRLVCLLAVGFMSVWALVNWVLLLVCAIDVNILRMDVMAVCLTIGNVICSIAAGLATGISCWAGRDSGWCLYIAFMGCMFGSISSVIATCYAFADSASNSSTAILVALSLIIPTLILSGSSLVVLQNLREEKDSDWAKPTKEETIPINRQPTDTQPKQPA
jgi:hypothetical protein